MKNRFIPDQSYSRDTGLIIVLILMITALWKQSLTPVLPATIVLLVSMVMPDIFKPAALIWYYFSLYLGNITNRIILTILFVLVVIPVAIVRKCFGFDPMRQKEWKNGTQSVFVERNHRFSSKDLLTPF